MATLMEKISAKTNPMHPCTGVLQKKLHVKSSLSVDAPKKKKPLPLPRQLINKKIAKYPVESAAEHHAIICMSRSLQDITSHDQVQDQMYQNSYLFHSEPNVFEKQCPLSPSCNDHFSHVPLATNVANTMMTKAIHDLTIKPKSASLSGLTDMDEDTYDDVYNLAPPGHYTVHTGMYVALSVVQ